MLRASYEAETPEWTVQARSRAAQAQLDAKSKAEVELLLMQARTALDPSIDVQVALNDLALNDLQARFPNDELINEAVHLNSNTE